MPALDHYDFEETLRRLEEISHWLNDLGFVSLDRVRVYRRNIRRMIEVQASGGMEALQESIPFEEAREISGAISTQTNSCEP